MDTTPDSEFPGIIFDLDGTLVDTLDDITEAINVLFEQRGLETLSRRRVRALIGQGLKHLIVLASGIEDADRVTELVEAYRPLYTERMLNQARLYPGVAEMLDGLSRLASPMAILSNKRDEFTGPMCEALLGKWPFVSWQGTMNEEDRKPNPDSALKIADDLGRSTADVIFLGDSTTDVLTAQNAGMRSVAATWGYRDLSELEAANPDHIINHPSEFVAIVQSYGDR